MGRPRKNAKPTAETPPVEETPQGHESVGGSPISKAQAVRNALAEGLDDLGDIEDFVKSQHGIEIPRQMISAYKSQTKSKLVSGKAVRGRKPKVTGEGTSAPRAARSTGSDGDLLDAFEALKPLVEKFGAEKIRRIVDLLG